MLFLSSSYLSTGCWARGRKCQNFIVQIKPPLVHNYFDKRSYIYGRVVAVITQHFELKSYTWVKLERIEIDQDLLVVAGQKFITMLKDQSISAEWLPYNSRGYKVRQHWIHRI